MGNAHSKYNDVVLSVPQGSALSDLMFALYVNDLPTQMESALISLYADDTKIYSAIDDQESIEELLRDVDRMVGWCNQWRLKINPEKCNLLQYNPRSARRQFSSTYWIEDVEILGKTEVRDLGNLISDGLKVHAQVNKTCRRAHMEINRIRRSFISRSPDFISNIWKLYVWPHLEYCAEVWNPKALGDINKMEKVENKMSKLARNCRRLRPEQRNEIMGITTHEKRRLRGALIYMYKHLDDETSSPSSICTST